jgi:Xaa-Pro dipeptidase
MYGTRVKTLQDSISEKKLDAFAIIPSPTMFYLTGLSFHLMERPVVAIFQPTEQPILLLPNLELAKAESTPIDFKFLVYGEDEESRTRAFESASGALGHVQLRIGIEPLRMRAFELDLLKTALPESTFVPASEVITKLRIIKDEGEIEAMRSAVSIAESAMNNTLPLIRNGMTEQELAAELVVQLLRSGSESEVPFSPIVASGPNSALPHAVPSERMLQEGDLLVIDWGARVEGYISDLTRTFAIGEIEEELAQIYHVVKAANAAGTNAIRPGISCSEIDQAARSEITAAGFGKYFIHRTGHGIGLESHEGPYIREDNLELLLPGMTFTVEPGIYLPNKGGVRIEDNVVTTQDGGVSLSTFTRELQTIS